MKNLFKISSVNYEPPDLAEQLPIYLNLERVLPGSDRPDYWLASLHSPLTWSREGKPSLQVTHLVLCSRYEGQTITLELNRLTVGIAYVIDNSLLSDNQLSFAKCEYVAIGELEASEDT